MALTASAEQSNSKRGAIVGIVIALHAAIFYVIESGLSHQIIELVAPPVETKIIDEDKKEEPPPPPPPPPDMPVTPPPFIPPPEVNVQVPVSTNAITTVTNERPPVTPPVVAPPPPPPAIPGTKPKLDPRRSRPPDDYYPSAAARSDQVGSAVVRCTVKLDGRCSESQILESSGFELLDQAALKYANEGVRFTPGTTNGVAAVMSYDFRVTFKQRTL